MSTAVGQGGVRAQGGGRPDDVASVPAGRFSGLLRAEAHRFLSRRFIQVVLALAVLGWLAAVLVASTQYSSAGPEELARAEQRLAQDVQQANRDREECLTGPDRPEDVPVDSGCGQEVRAEDYEVASYLIPAPFSLADEGQGGAIAFGAAAAVLAFLIGATFVGAEWSTRSMVALLFWETRRTRVLGAKALVVVGAALLIGLAAAAMWLAMASLLRAVAGDGARLPDDFWSGLLSLQGRGVLLALLAGLLGFGLTHLVRNTGAALGIAFVYVAIAETAVRIFLPNAQPWLLTNNAIALVVPDGLTLYIPQRTLDGSGLPVEQGTEYVLGNLQAGLWLGAVAAVVIGAGMVLFARRDLH
ncbi:ABC transporter permease subunit [Modestobacter sp. I12A-02628]|uniref:ABC transporter permease subunit n=1 Tax=Goekera deserti TaxID=2497753 RepID=A0A7K3WDP4_9ACTN|nr:ABC transporter permease subunit [Goekera deserti]MPQ97140.1 ABC transporter permease subunit [Goekera deserti]NDI46542.1 ABC transporter permease subunit [Goekera deserti]NEL54524.1 ABC transporter permease subunit [Goekera deserti]